MIGYITLGTNNLSAAAGFYDAVLGQLGATRSRSSADLVGWRFPSGGSELYVLKPYDGNTAFAGNGPMVGLHAGNRTLVNAVYAKAIECGGLDEGEPGPRQYSAGFLRRLLPRLRR